MKVHQETLEVETRGKRTYEVTGEVQGIVSGTRVRKGVATVFIQHTSCSLLLMENAAPAARRDLEAFFEKLVPEGDGYEHDDEGPDDMPAHIRMALTRSSETIPISGGDLQLGTWQGIFLFEHRRQPHRRRIFVTVIGE